MSSASEIANFISTHDNFLITAHVFPDGDNMGSVLAMQEILVALGKKCACYLEGTLPKMYRWMPGADHIDSDLDRALSSLDDPPTLIVVDSGDLDRPGETFKRWFSAQDNLEIANIDHHVTNAYFGTVNWVEPDYSSVGEMMFDIIRELGLEFTPTIAQNLFVSIYTDTGRFSFSNTTERSFRYAGELVNAGASPIGAFRNVYASRSFASFHLQTLSFQTLTMFNNNQGCYFWVDQKMLAKTDTTIDDTDGFIDTVRTLEGFLIAVFLKEVGREDIRISVRALPPINASMLMGLFGGGGHPRAAGCRINKPLHEAIELFVSTAEEAIDFGEVLDK